MYFLYDRITVVAYVHYTVQLNNEIKFMFIHYITYTHALVSAQLFNKEYLHNAFVINTQGCDINGTMTKGNWKVNKTEKYTST